MIGKSDHGAAMQIELLDTFLDLIETRSFHRTADRLRLTQSTVSARVMALEQAAGARLFTRSRAGTNLSTEGLKFEPHARALRHAWTEAQRAVEPSPTAITLRIGIQNDLAAGQIGDWVANFRRALPDCSFYLEPDYSIQMCRDLDRGALDFAVVYSPQSLSDLHIVSLGEVRYRLISTDGATRDKISPTRYVRGSYSPAFDVAHGHAMPEYGAALLASGQNAAVAGLLQSLGGSGFVLDDTAARMTAEGRFHAVTDVEPIGQPIYAVMHQRHRTSRMHRRLTRIVAKEIAGKGGHDRDQSSV
jgi:LysR family transcriptional regulator, flagellar master operon regulator